MPTSRFAQRLFLAMTLLFCVGLPANLSAHTTPKNLIAPSLVLKNTLQLSLSHAHPSQLVQQCINALFLSEIATLDTFFPSLKDDPHAMQFASPWVIPHRSPWPTNDAGIPLVTTEPTQALWHTITRRRDLRWVKQRYRTNLTTLQKLNPDIDLLSLSEGDEIKTWQRDNDTISYGRGTPNRGRLVDGEPLPTADKYVIMHQHRAFGTYYITSHLKELFDTYALAFPEAQPVVIGDLSHRTGRRIKPHLSHQSGRDVDITYPRHDEPKSFTKFHYIRRSNLDATRTLWLVKQMAQSGYVEKIFMDYWVQRKLYHEAQERGAPQEWLDAVFQYPKWGGQAFIERAKGHDDHMHIRYYCQHTDMHCKLSAP